MTVMMMVMVMVCADDALFTRVGIDPKTRKIMSMKSAEGEEVPLTNPVVVDGNIEDWLLLLEAEMRRTVKVHITW